MPEFNTTTGYVCPHDISNAASMWVGLVLGLILGGVITWWVYYRQKKISEKQDHVLAQNDRYGKKNLGENPQFG